MLDPVTAHQFLQRMGSGRTRPSLLTCSRQDGTDVEAVVKLSAGCELGTRALVAEALAALLAADLGLSCPEPFLVLVEARFAEIIPDAEIRSLAGRSTGWNFGARRLPPGFATIPADRAIPVAQFKAAAEILAFDVFIANDDRRVCNPNCLVRGDELAIFDHEFAFFFDAIIGWKAPWQDGGIRLSAADPKQCHVFFEGIRRKKIDFSRLSAAFHAISPQRLEDYGEALPPDWCKGNDHARRILNYLSELIENIDTAINLLEEALL